jgi:predicted nucleic acid-binding Zn ribbon protein
MPLQPLGHVLGGLHRQYQRRAPAEIDVVLQYWPTVVGLAVAAQTQPVQVYRGILKVATASAVWAQNLVFERQRIAEKLNQVLPFTIVEIRFSTAQWGQTPVVATFPGDSQQRSLWQQHPSRLQGTLPPSFPRPAERTRSPDTPALPHPFGRPSPETAPPRRSPADAAAAFRQWAKWVQQRDLNHLPCPHCQSPTPPGELERWGICGLCASQQWQ